MIVFDLGCDNGHVFEAWFGSSDDYEQQRTRGLVTCPMCGSLTVEKAVMAPRVARKGNQIAIRANPADQPSPVPQDGPSPEQAKAMLKVLAEAQAETLKNSEWVGKGFADQARAMHLGDVEHRSIHGQTTPEEAKSLLDDGVPVAPLPFPVRPPGADN
jgi:hypothetical protein